MADYKRLVKTTRGTYRLWGKDEIDSIDLSNDGTGFAASILTKQQSVELWDYAETELTDSQITKMKEYYVLPGRF